MKSSMTTFGCGKRARSASVPAPAVVATTTTVAVLESLDGGDDQLARVGVVDGALRDRHDFPRWDRGRRRERGVRAGRAASGNQRSDVLGVGEWPVAGELQSRRAVEEDPVCPAASARAGSRRGGSGRCRAGRGSRCSEWCRPSCRWRAACARSRGGAGRRVCGRGAVRRTVAGPARPASPSSGRRRRPGCCSDSATSCSA